ncbi:alpha/beta hydrolase [Blautia producta]|uniref:Aminoacrylate hydrolase RutD n=1 Tax=Blautia producta TaxID=33035 RepID=A0A4P6M108_9FIRM|nr:alpha/beta fold hydrolase [Blautia producta]QBE97765.1 Putative aminoacrylate hydrolase RutD [Blautia producta]
MDVEIKREGILLRGRIDRPETEKCPVVILFHGFTGDLGYEKEDLYSVLAKKLKESGIATVRFDFDGHGKSGGRFEEMDILREIEDAIAILNYVRSLGFVSEIYILGHSQGGVVGGMLAGFYADIIKKLVLLAPAATLQEDAWMGTCMGVKYDTEHIPDTVSLDEGTLKVGGHYFRTAKFLPIYEAARAFKGPALAIHGRKDTIVSPSASERYGKEMPDCRVKYFEDLDHGFEGDDREAAVQEAVDFLSLELE